MSKIAYQIKKQSIKSPLKAHFFKLNNIFSIFICIFLLSSFVSLCSYIHNFSIFTDYNDRHYIFLLCNGILAFLIKNFNSTHVSSPKKNQYDIEHQPMLISSEPIVAIEKHDQEIKQDDDKLEHKGNRVLLIEEDQNAIVEEQKTGESNVALETEELNKKCAEFITKMKERMQRESWRGNNRLPPSKISAINTC